jgi:hypothetical protein
VRPLMADRGGSGHRRIARGRRSPYPFISGLGRLVHTTSRPRARRGMGSSMGEGKAARTAGYGDDVSGRAA